MDEFTTRIEELNSKLSFKRNSPSQQNINLQSETCNGSVPTSYFVSGLGNGSLTGSIIPSSSSFSQLVKDSPIMDEVNDSAQLSCCYFCSLVICSDITWLVDLLSDIRNLEGATASHAPIRLPEQSSPRT